MWTCQPIERRIECFDTRVYWCRCRVPLVWSYEYSHLQSPSTGMPMLVAVHRIPPWRGQRWTDMMLDVGLTCSNKKWLSWNNWSLVLPSLWAAKNDRPSVLLLLPVLGSLCTWFRQGSTVSSLFRSQGAPACDHHRWPKARSRAWSLRWLQETGF